MNTKNQSCPIKFSQPCKIDHCKKNIGQRCSDCPFIVKKGKKKC